MNSNPALTSSLSDPIPSSGVTHHVRPMVSWPAIFAGILAALALQVLFMLLGAGLGFAIYTPLTDDNPIANFGAGAAIVQGISAVFSLWFGGWVAGRFTPVGTRLTGGLHGFLVWSAATVAGILVVASGAGWALGGIAKVVGGGMSLVAKPVAAAAGGAADGAADLAKNALKQSGDALSSFTDEAVASRTSGATPNTTIRAKREIGMALARAFNPAESSNPAEARAALVKALTDNAGMSEADANRMVTEWTASYDRLKADLAAAKNEAEAKARVAADKAAEALAIFSFCAFGAFVLGAAAATFGGEHGATCAIRRHNRPELAV